MKNHVEIIKKHVFSKVLFFLLKKSPRQGCTTPKTELGMHQNPHFQQNPLKINENPKITHCQPSLFLSLGEGGLTEPYG